MSFDIEPDGPIHGECSTEIHSLRARLDAVTAERDEAKGLADAYLEGSAEWEESFHQAKALEKAAIQKGQRHKVERDALKAKCEKYEGLLKEAVYAMEYGDVYDRAESKRNIREALAEKETK